MSFIPVAVPYLVEQHVEEASFLWTSRDRATSSAAYDLDDIASLDRRVAAQMDGLRIAAETGWEIALEALEFEMDAGTAFVAAHLALELGDIKGFAKVLDLVEAEPAAWRALPSAIGFSEFERVDKVLAALIAESVPAPMKRMGISGHAVHRRHPGPALGWALADADRELRLRGLEAVGELGDASHLDSVTAALASEDDEERFWAARSGSLFGDAAAVTELQRLAELEQSFAEQAARLAASALSVSAADAWVRQLDARGHRRVALRAAAASGASTLVPWLLGLVQEEAHARLVGHALYAITGVPIDDALEADGPDEIEDEEDDFDDEDLDLDFEDDLPWPDVGMVTAHFASHPTVEERLLLGKPCDATWLDVVLREGLSPQREVAAWHRCRRAPGASLFEVRAPGWRQLATLPAASVDPD